LIGSKIGPNAQWIIGAIVASIPLLFAWGFYKNHAGAYNAYILLAIIQLPKQFSGFADSPVATAIGLAVGAGLLIFVWYVRQKLFPDFAFTAPKKVKGQYVFSDQPEALPRTAQTAHLNFTHPAVAIVQSTEIPADSGKPESARASRKIFFAFLALVALGGAVYLAIPKNMQYALQDAAKRPFAPNFDLPPSQMKSVRQDEWIAEYRRRGYDLHCYGNLRPEERISKDDDYNCWGLIKSAYDNIPARMIVFWFRKGELRHIKIELPESSFASMQDYLGRHFEGIARLDQLPGRHFGKDIYGNQLMVWPTQYGVVVTSNTPTSGRPLTLLWSSHEAVVRDMLAGLKSGATENAKLLSQVEATALPVGETHIGAAPVKPLADEIAGLPRQAEDSQLASAALHEQKRRKPTDLRHCLALKSNYEIAQCANQSR
ncbi:MAG TPA: hypothetical protein VFW53_05815, partial [Gallionella sp.]|nr:hypothetical protein [Gallionella sp.]